MCANMGKRSGMQPLSRRFREDSVEVSSVFYNLANLPATTLSAFTKIESFFTTFNTVLSSYSYYKKSKHFKKLIFFILCS